MTGPTSDICISHGSEFLYEVKSCFLFIIYRANASLIKFPLRSLMIKSPFEFVECRLKIASRWHILIHTFYMLLFSVIVQRFQLKRSESIRVSKDSDLDKRKYICLGPVGANFVSALVQNIQRNIG